MSAQTGASDDPRGLSNGELERRYAALHREVFALYESAQGGAGADTTREGTDAAHRQAQARAQPLVEQARRLHQERVRRLRRRARRWWWATGAITVTGTALVLWLIARG
ncbi:hypothetical protein [Luteimonas sp. MHLX1A]|uniref:hypothetical protein n=1 Tax=Alterluteimonas muca TaxID=2878684 RepID=UPI001E2E0033|nr:hypothetical protein [Luteimonas sp. MHLX1A]MCD9045424.1 hypothetical protein [Luteimonas sp. MHLX1A]